MLVGFFMGTINSAGWRQYIGDLMGVLVGPDGDRPSWGKLGRRKLRIVLPCRMICLFFGLQYYWNNLTTHLGIAQTV